MKAFKRCEDGRAIIDVPRDAITLTNNLDKVIECASCGLIMKYGDSYTSSFIVNEKGTGYAICKDCRSKERRKRFDYYKRKGF